ncbi:MAG: DUF1398 domain-containing protein [Sphingobacteriales bacterium JAD_PAG50586_3]|nr:MAG: DUF1398 domain-containing protein [Sphingobacteriales bacterium JAD_PAG50586_3]
MQNNILLPLQEIGRTAKSYAELAQGMINIGIQSYTVDVATGTTLYRLADGEFALKEGHGEALAIGGAFNNDATLQAVKDTQAGKTTYPEFMDAIAAAGVRFYEATLQGKPRVTYIGTGGYYEEEIPL